MHLLRVRRVHKRNRERRLDTMLLHGPDAFRTHDAWEHKREKSEESLGGNTEIGLLQQL